jgi:PleD family two-component response regulator
VTISLGSSTYLPTSSASPIDNEISSRLIKSADSALYKAKRNGRNRVENGGVISEKPVLDKVTVF